MEVKEKSQSIVKLNPQEYGLTETKAKEIEAMFQPMLQWMVELEGEFNEITKLEISKETCKKARELRLKYVKVRTGTAAIHRELKDFYLKGGRFVDGWKNAQLFASQGIEEKLTAIENHYENLERERIAKLQEKRADELSKYDVGYIPDNLGQMSDDVWNNFLLGTKTNYEAQREAERKAEEERQEKIKLDKRESDRREKILPYREYWQGIIDAGGLRDLSDELFEDIFKKLADKKKEHDQKQEQIRKENLRLQKEAEEREEKERKALADYEAKLKKEREERECAEAELRAKQEAEEQARIEAERKAKAEEQARKKAERNAELAPDKKKLQKLASDIEMIQFPDVKSQEAFEIIRTIKNKLEQVNQYIITQSKNL